MPYMKKVIDEMIERDTRDSVLVTACGVLAREITVLKQTHGWDHLHLKCIDARRHNRPELIPGRLRDKIRQFKDEYDQIFVAYADCGTGGIERFEVSRRL